MAQILWRDSQGKEGALDLGAAETRIGRAMDCAVRTDDAMVSRHHARIYWAGNGYVVQDLGSANGVYFQEQRVTQHALSHGDAVRCGSLWLRYVDPARAGISPQLPATPPSRPQPPPPAQPQTPPPPQGFAPPAQTPPAHALGPMPAHPSGPHGAPGAADDEAAEEIRRLRRRIDQLQTELRILRGGKRGAEQAKKFEDLENEFSALEEERDQLRARIEELEQQIATEGGDIKVKRAGQIAQKASEAVSQLNDVLSNLRINVMAAEGEFEQFASQLPKASFELIREALRSSSADVENARELLRALRELAK